MVHAKHPSHGMACFDVPFFFNNKPVFASINGKSTVFKNITEIIVSYFFFYLFYIKVSLIYFFSITCFRIQNKNYHQAQQHRIFFFLNFQKEYD